MALTTGNFLTDAGNPDNGNGSDGDHYRDTANQNLWFKAAGSWTLVGNLNDNTPDGIGTIWLNGSGVPLNLNGANGYYYRNTDNQDVWFKVGGFWTLIFGTTQLTSATSGVRSINGIQPDEGGDVTLLIEDLGGTQPSIDDHVADIDPHGDRAYTDQEFNSHNEAADPHGDRAYADSLVVSAAPPIITVIQRGHKFGIHSRLGYTIPVIGPYQGSSDGSTPLSSVALVEALTNRGNIADCALWEMNKLSADYYTQVALSMTVGSSGPYPQQQWRTGAKMQFLASLALYNVIPTSENFVYRIGLADVVRSDHHSADPWAGYASIPGNEHTGCAAMFIADNTSIYWQCKSGYKTSTQTTVTSVPYVVGNFDVFHVCVTATGAVEFRINGTLVATHSGLGVIPDGAYLSEGVAVRNIAATTTAKKGFWLDEFAFRLNLPSARTGFAFT